MRTQLPSDGKQKLEKTLSRLKATLIEVSGQFERGALSPGRPDWAEKWEKCQGKRILFFTYTDFAGSFYKWAEAVNRHSAHAVRIVHLTRHRFGNPVDLLYLRGGLIKSCAPWMAKEIEQLADEADIIHIKDQAGFWSGANGLPTDFLEKFGKPIIYTFYGGHARSQEFDPDFRRHVSKYDAVVAMTPDLCFEWAAPQYVHQCIDEDIYEFSWSDGATIMHTPSTPSRKGTDLFAAAADRIDREFGTHTEIITGVTQKEAIGHKRRATVFFDQAGRESEENGGKLIGWYGISALEAAVFGIPTMAHLSQEAIDRAERAGYSVRQESAILNVEPTEEGMYRVMRDFFEMSSHEREQIALRTRRWIENHHSYRATAAKLGALYNSL